MLLVGIIGCIFYYFFCCKCSLNGNSTTDKKNTTVVAPVTVNKPKVPTPTSNAFALSDSEGNFSFKANEHFNFNANGFNLLSPISLNVDAGIDKLKTYLTTHPEKTLDIIGLYTSKEENTSAYPNLGIARANSIKNYLVGKGISSKQLNTDGRLDDNLIPNGIIYQGPVDYKFNTFESVADEEAQLKVEIEALRKEILADPLKLNFETGSSLISLTATQRAKMAKLSRYLDKADNGLIDIIGHTDNTGSLATNIKLGMDRANTIKKYLIKNGINAAKIKTLSKGPNKPIATNSTADGRNKNRRVEITLE